MKILNISKNGIAFFAVRHADSKDLDTEITSPGITVYIVIGKWAGIGVLAEKSGRLAIYLGCIAIEFMLEDLDLYMLRIAQTFRKQDYIIQALKEELEEAKK